MEIIRTTSGDAKPVRNTVVFLDTISFFTRPTIESDFELSNNSGKK